MCFRIKQLFFWAAYRIDQCVPRPIGVLLRNRCWPWRLVLDAVELHLADRCNMNCTGCSHFSPFAAAWFARADQVGRDLALLRSKFAGGIRHVNLLGGEPLLNREIGAILERVRETCPEALITVVTNGINLLDQPAEFWTMCRRVRLRLNLTLYGPMMPKRRLIEEKCARENVALRVQEGTVFFARMVPEGTANARKSFRFCRRTTYCPYLRDGRLYTCAQAYHIRDFVQAARRAGRVVADVVDEGLDLHDPALTGKKILHALMTPGPVCRLCAAQMRLMPWSNGSKDVRDWCLERGDR